MRSNAGQIGVSQGTHVAANLYAEMALYDRLSSKSRRLLDEAPIEQQVLEFCAVIEHYGEERACELICELLEKNFPGWRRP